MWQQTIGGLRQIWSRMAPWKRTVAIAIGLSLLFQLGFAFSLWRETLVRHQLARKAVFSLGKSPLSLTAQQALKRFVSPETLQLLAPVEAVSIDEPTEDDFHLIARLNIKCLSIGSENLDAVELKLLRSISQLEALELFGDCTDAKTLAPLADCGTLCKLRIAGKLTPDALRPLRDCVSLIQLYLLTNDDGARESESDPITESQLAEVARIPNLKSLIVSSPGMSGTALGALADAQRLEKLFVTHANFRNASLDRLGQVPQLKLLSVNLDNTYCVEPLHGFPTLSTLVVRSAKISPQFLSSLRSLPHLDTLQLRECWLGESLSALANNSKLKRLHLYRCDENVEGILSIGRLSALEVLHSGVEIEEFGHLFPRLKPATDFDWDFGLDKYYFEYGETNVEMGSRGSGMGGTGFF